MIYTQLGHKCEIVGFGQSDPHETDISRILVKLLPAEGETIEGLQEFLYFTSELVADDGRKEISQAISALVR